MSQIIQTKTMTTGILLLMSFLLQLTTAQIYTGEKSNRVKINLGNTPWKFVKQDLYPQAKELSFNDAAWENVGIPHCYNDMDTYLNVTKGNQNPFLGTAWYRKHFTLDQRFQGRKALVEFEGVNVGAAVYINGKFLSGNSKVVNQEATHVHGFIGFVVDITDYVTFGTQENVLAVRVSNKSVSWFVWPGFGTRFDFSMGMGGIFRPVYLHLTDKTYIPLNTFSVVENWGTYIATVSASASTSKIRFMTNVQNDNTQNRNVSLTTIVTDANNNIVLTLNDTGTVNAGSSQIFDRTGDISNPQRWYPAASTFGKPYLYHVYSVVKVNGTTIDVFESPLGIRTITWNADYPLINGEIHKLWGFGQRYEYPALGSAVPEEQQWRDIKLITECGGRFLRPGHNACSPATVNACDAYGVCIAQPSGDDEHALNSTNNNLLTLKKELHRDLIIRDRNHPSMLMWEMSNGSCTSGLTPALIAIAEKWDTVHTRLNSMRTYWENPVGDIVSGKMVIGHVLNIMATSALPDWNAEAWPVSSPRHDWAQEKNFAVKFVSAWNKDCATPNSAFAYAQWYLAETQGENAWQSGYLNGKPADAGRSLGCSAMDGNRIPKLIYQVWKNAQWIPYSIRPGVALQSHWNLSGTVDVDAWSNCTSVELFINGASKGVKNPDAANRRCTWTGIPWQAGTIRAEGRDGAGKVVCFDEKTTAGTPHYIVLSMDPALKKPDGKEFKIFANGSDAGFVLATIVDDKGIWCPLAENTITFSVTGPGNYRGSYNFWVTNGQSLSYHAPGDKELQAEGGMMKVAVKSTFTPGTVNVTATSSGLGNGQTSFVTHPPESSVVAIVEKPMNSSSGSHSCARRTYATTVSFYYKELGKEPETDMVVYTITGRKINLGKQGMDRNMLRKKLSNSILIISKKVK